VSGTADYLAWRSTRERREGNKRGFRKLGLHEIGRVIRTGRDPIPMVRWATPERKTT
jgi:hypothetical protein